MDHSAFETSDIVSKIQAIQHLKKGLTAAKTVYEKVEILDQYEHVKHFFAAPSVLKSFLSGVSPDCEYIIKVVIAIQQEQIFTLPEGDPLPRLRKLVEVLLQMEHFYADVGGIVGYQELVLTLLSDSEVLPANEQLEPPKKISLMNKDLRVKKAIIEGIKHQGKMAEIYPVGGVADRLQLKSDDSDDKLPAARLVFLGKPLLQGVIHDLQAREYLHYKLFDQHVVTPIAMMTSCCNHNEAHIYQICEQNRWFGRDKESIRLVSQPAVPCFTQHGDWCLSKPLQLVLKPGGHGIIWKLFEQQGIFDWFLSQGISKALVRQINNPMAGIDYGLAAFLGLGHIRDGHFGFASCPRLVNAHEGMNVVKVSQQEADNKRCLTNIEYCDFEKFGIKDCPYKEGSSYSLFPSNTNILFADIAAVSKAVKHHPFPGLIVNFKHAHHWYAKQGKEAIARLETTMQNIADSFKESQAYLTFNERRKTISTTKRKSTKSGSLLETPEGCYYDFMLNACELLESHCQIALPDMPNPQKFYEEGPAFLFSYHPALGPLYSIIGQKIRHGRLHQGAELQLEIADLEIDHLELNGSLLIHADRVMGHFDEHKRLVYSQQTGQCILKNVCVNNKGINWEEDHLFWKHEIHREEALHIRLLGHSQFIAENVTFDTGCVIEVPDGIRMIAKQEEGRVTFVTEALIHNEAFWQYSVDDQSDIQLCRAAVTQRGGVVSSSH